MFKCVYDVSSGQSNVAFYSVKTSDCVVFFFFFGTRSGMSSDVTSPKAQFVNYVAFYG